jgi:CHAD domain-containing protein
VQLAFLDEKLAAQRADERAALAPIRERLVARQQKARARLLKALDSPPVQAWMRDWRQHLAACTPGSSRAQRILTAVAARKLIREQARRLRKRAQRLDDNSPADDYHAVRIRAKRLRYTIDAFASLYGEAAGDYVRALARLQTTLGEYNDSKVREQKFAELVSQGPRLPAATSFLAGRLVERDAHAAERLRRDFSRAWRRIRRRRWRALATVMKREAQSAPGTLDSVKPG